MFQHILLGMDGAAADVILTVAQPRQADLIVGGPWFKRPAKHPARQDEYDGRPTRAVSGVSCEIVGGRSAAFGSRQMQGIYSAQRSIGRKA